MAFLNHKNGQIWRECNYINGNENGICKYYNTKGLLIYYGVKHHDYHDIYTIFSKLENISDVITDKLPSIV